MCFGFGGLKNKILPPGRFSHGDLRPLSFHVIDAAARTASTLRSRGAEQDDGLKG